MAVKNRKFLGIAALVLCLGVVVGSVATYAVMQWIAKIPTTASLKLLGVGVYKDVSFTVPVTEIDWGILEPGQSKNYSAYIKNESNVPITLTMYTESWNPLEASNFITFSWDYQATLIGVGGSVPVTFLLTVDPATTGFKTFTYTIVIVGSG